jgi:hypothetical protein
LALLITHCRPATHAHDFSPTLHFSPFFPTFVPALERSRHSYSFPIVFICFSSLIKPIGTEGLSSKVIWLAFLPASCWCLAWLTFHPEDGGVTHKHQLTFNGLCSITSQKTELYTSQLQMHQQIIFMEHILGHLGHSLSPVRTRAQMLRHTVSGQSCSMCLDKSQSVPQQISCADTWARLSVERRQHEETSKDLS